MVVGLAVAAVDRLVLMWYDYHLRMDYILLKYLKVEQLVRLVEQLDPIINWNNIRNYIENNANVCDNAYAMKTTKIT